MGQSKLINTLKFELKWQLMGLARSFLTFYTAN